ncbi:hypothetical protein KIS4809_3569 [Bacillus sp. ZZV12-4809]|nr:hypothetical protein KIS4809_3569 [Bacillus sp. ZZV12-4809]
MMQISKSIFVQINYKRQFFPNNMILTWKRRITTFFCILIERFKAFG